MNSTSITQPALLLTSVGYWRAFAKEVQWEKPALFLGHSIGEYAALTAAGSLQFDDAVRLVQLRGKLMESSRQYTEEMGMVALMPTPSALLNLKERIRDLGNIDIAAFNSPTQIMISGLKKDLAASCEILKSQKLIKASKVLENVHIAFHSRLMLKAKMAFMSEIEKIDFMPLNRNCLFISNNTGQIESYSQVKDLLARQFTEPVLWQSSVETCLRVDPSIKFVEFGPGKVLTRMLRKDFGVDQIIEPFET